MRSRLLGVLAALGLLAGPASAETLGALLRAHGVTPPGGLAHQDQPIETFQVLDDERELLVVYTLGEGEAPLRATLWRRGPGTWAVATLVPGAAPVPMSACRTGLAVDRFAGGFLLRAHINPSAECTIVLGPDLSLRGVLAGWPVAILADGRIVYQRNQVHFAPVHPVALALFDPNQRAETALYPTRPYGPIRAAHIARIRSTYSEAWCRARHHPCDPELFDEHLSGQVLADPRGDTLAFVTAWDNTTGWSDAERWGRLETFRELRAAVGGWNGRGTPPGALYRGLAAGLARARNLHAEGHVAAALADRPDLAALVSAALAGRPAPSQDARGWLLSLDGRWADARTWNTLGRAVAVPDEFTEVVHVYSGLRRPDRAQHRELRRRDFETRFGPGAPGRALDPAVVREIFRTTGP